MSNLKQTNKERYSLWCETQHNLPLFIQPWWMDAVCKKNVRWEVFLFEENDEIKGVFVCHIVKKGRFRLVIQPQLTQYNGIWLKYDDKMSASEKLYFEKKAITYLISQLNKSGFDYFNQNFPLNFQNWLPFYWQNFTQTTRYTYQIKDIRSSESFFDEYSNAKQRQYRKAEKTLKIYNQMDGKEFYAHLSHYYKSKGKKLFYSESFFLNLYNACKSKNQGKIIAVTDSNNIVHAALFVVWDNVKAYNLILTINKEQLTSGASTMVVHEAIKQMSEKVNIFDFEGSMEKNIENSYSQFATEQVPYFNIKKTNSRLLQILFNFQKKWI